jgi:2,4-dienoyl-CoA reductase-like NADH-dependent reductase (Old Yellow Enzyme family)
MTTEEVSATVRAFGQAAARAKEAGFDGVQLHAAHGYLLSEFLSPFFNKRDDEYGGSIDNRARIVLDAVRNVRAAVGDEFPVLVKINSTDMLEGGFTIEDMLQIAAMLESAGVDAIELSGGTSLALYLGNPNISWARVYPLDTADKEAYYREAAKLYREKILIPLMLVGGIRSFEVAEQLVEEGTTDYVSLCRPLIREPNLINRWEAGDTRRSECISDNGCIGALVAGEGAHCVHVDSE